MWDLPSTRALACFVLGALATGCGETGRHPAPEKPEGSRLRILGTAQDGGLPHAACDCTRCRDAERHPERRRRVASLALILPTTDEVFLVDATPDIRDQLAMLRDVRDDAGDRVDRSPVSGVLLTHAHLGHYTGLAFLGFEAIHARGIPVFCSPSMAAYLRANAPWSGLIERGNISIREIRPGQRFDLGDVSVEPVAVPHRDEYTDTIGFVFHGPRLKALYVPDMDSWDDWSPSVAACFDGLDHALVDGTFFSMDELPGRDVGAIGHPLITDTMDRLDEYASSGTGVYFIHLNHSNPASDADSPERRDIERRGFRVADDGLELPL